MDSGDDSNEVSDAWWEALTSEASADAQDQQQRELHKLIMVRQAEAEKRVEPEKLAAGRQRLLHALRESSTASNLAPPRHQPWRMLALAASLLVGVGILFTSFLSIESGNGQRVLRSGGNFERVRGVDMVYRINDEAPDQLAQSLSDALTASSIDYELVAREDGVLALTLDAATVRSAQVVNDILVSVDVEVPGPGQYQVEIRKRE